jgi:hypothetical protein
VIKVESDEATTKKDEKHRRELKDACILPNELGIWANIRRQGVTKKEGKARDNHKAFSSEEEEETLVEHPTLNEQFDYAIYRLVFAEEEVKGGSRPALLFEFVEGFTKVCI